MSEKRLLLPPTKDAPNGRRHVTLQKWILMCQRRPKSGVAEDAERLSVLAKDAAVDWHGWQIAYKRLATETAKKIAELESQLEVAKHSRIAADENYGRIIADFEHCMTTMKDERKTLFAALKKLAG